MFKLLAKTYFSTFLVILLSFTTSVFLARFLSLEERGLYGNFILVGSLAAGFSQFGIGQAFLYYVNTGNKWFWNKLINISCALSIILNILLSLFFYYLFFDKLDYSLAAILLLFSFISNIYGIYINISQLDKSFFIYNFSRVVSAFFIFLYIIIIFYFYNLNVYNLIIFQTIILFIFCFYIKLSIKTEISKKSGIIYSREKLRDFLFFGLKVHATSVIGILINNTDKIYIALFGGLKNLGIYGVAYAFSRVFSSLLEALSTIIYAKFTGLLKEDRINKINKVFRYAFYPSILVALIFSFFMKDLVYMIYGDKYVDYYIVFIILIFESVLGGGSWLLAQHFSTSGRPELVFYRQLFSFLPIAIGVFFINGENMIFEISYILLFSVVVRFILTIAFCIKLYKVELMDFIINKEDFIYFYNVFVKNGK